MASASRACRARRRARAELGDQGAADDVVGEAVAVGALLDDQARRQRGVEGVERGRLVEARGAAATRSSSKRAPATAAARSSSSAAPAEAGQPAGDQVLDARRDRRSPAVSPRAQHLGDQERVAGGLGHQPPGRRPTGRRRGRRALPHQVAHLGLVEAPQRQAPHPAVAVEGVDHVAQRVARLQVVVAGDGHHQHRRVARPPQQVAHEQQRVVVGPLEVVEHQQHGRSLGRRRHQVGDRLEQPGPPVGPAPRPPGPRRATAAPPPARPAPRRRAPAARRRAWRRRSRRAPRRPAGRGRSPPGRTGRTAPGRPPAPTPAGPPRWPGGSCRCPPRRSRPRRGGRPPRRCSQAAASAASSASRPTNGAGAGGRAATSASAGGSRPRRPGARRRAQQRRGRRPRSRATGSTPELVGQHPAQPLVGPQRLGPVAGGGVGRHPAPVGALPQRRPGDGLVGRGQAPRRRRRRPAPPGSAPRSAATSGSARPARSSSTHSPWRPGRNGARSRSRRGRRQVRAPPGRRRPAPRGPPQRGPRPRLDVDPQVHARRAARAVAARPAATTGSPAPGTAAASTDRTRLTCVRRADAQVARQAVGPHVSASRSRVTAPARSSSAAASATGHRPGERPRRPATSRRR